MPKKLLNGKVALVTGACGGIGSEIRRLFRSHGANMSLVDIDERGLADLAEELKGKEIIVRCDIADAEQVKFAVAETVSRYSRVDILVNNAGIIIPELFEDTSDEAIEKQVRVNLMGAIYFIRECIPVMKKTGGGSIVTVSSLAGIVPETRGAVYAATKFALRGLCLTLNLELRRHNIFVSTVFPDSVDTPMLEREAEGGGSPLTFLNKPRKPEEAAKGVLKAVTRKKIEVYVPAGTGFQSRLAAVFPSAIPALWPVLEKLGEKNKKKYLDGKR